MSERALASLGSLDARRLKDVEKTLMLRFDHIHRNHRTVSLSNDIFPLECGREVDFLHGCSYADLYWYFELLHKPITNLVPFIPQLWDPLS